MEISVYYCHTNTLAGYYSANTAFACAHCIPQACEISV